MKKPPLYQPRLKPLPDVHQRLDTPGGDFQAGSPATDTGRGRIRSIANGEGEVIVSVREPLRAGPSGADLNKVKPFSLKRYRLIQPHYLHPAVAIILQPNLKANGTRSNALHAGGAPAVLNDLQRSYCPAAKLAPMPNGA